MELKNKTDRLETEKTSWELEKKRYVREHSTDEIIIVSLKEQIKVKHQTASPKLGGADEGQEYRRIGREGSRSTRTF